MSDGALEDVAVGGVVGAGGFRVGDVEDLAAKFREEEGVVGFFGAAGFFPTGDEGSDGFGDGSGIGYIRTNLVRMPKQNVGFPWADPSGKMVREKIAGSCWHCRSTPPESVSEKQADDGFEIGF